VAHIEKRKTKSGDWRYEVRYRGPDGKERSATKRTRKDAERFARDVESAKDRGMWVDPQLNRRTFEEWAKEWRGTTVHLKPRTRASYESILDSRLLPKFSTTPVGRIDHAAVRTYVAELTQAGAKPGTVRNVFRVLSLVLDTARRSGALAVNPAAGVKMPRSERSEMVFLTAEQVLTLADAIGDEYRLMVVFAAYTGLRAGEIAALRVCRVDLLRRVIDVRASLADVNGHLIEGPTKTHQRRTVPLPAFLADEIAVHIASRAHRPDAFVFTGPEGAPIRHGNFYRRHFRPAVAASGVPSATRFHDLRHTCASLLIAQGAHPKAIAELLGHSTITVTLDRYGHLFEGIAEQLAVGLDATYRAAQRPASLSLRSAG
jgi:integrase